jgi:chemotaxis protein methyltransferase CheR
LSRFCTSGYGRIAMHEEVRRNISFFQHDLIGDHVFAEMDLVLCRNVLIYFGRALKDRVLQKLADSLRPGGFLCLGASEQLPRERRSPFVEFAPEQRIYRREPST